MSLFKLRVFGSVLIILTLFISSCAPTRETITRSKPTIESVVHNLQTPWSIAVSKQTFYITERKGNIVKVESGKVTRQPVTLQKPVYQRGEGGLLGIVLSPDFNQTRQAYLYHTYLQNNHILNRVVLTQQTDTGWKEVKALLEGIPGAANHDGGRLGIGPDQYLYVTTGDALEEMSSQDKNSLAGKILRMRLDGGIPQDNPFAGSYIYSYGHRNPQGLDWTTSGELYASEHGPVGHDEINKIESGKNYGWPWVIGDEKKDGIVTPVYQSGNDTWAPSGLKINKENQLIVATLRGEKLLQFDTNQKKIITLLEGVGRLRDVYILGDDIYVITNNTDGRGTPKDGDDRLLRIRTTN